MAMKPRAMTKKKPAATKTKMMRGGMTAKAGKASGGMTKSNAGASMKPAQKGTPKPAMMRGGMTKKSGSAKMMRGGMTKKK